MGPYRLLQYKLMSSQSTTTGKESPFTTTTDVLNQLNQTLAKLEDDNNNGTTTSTTIATTQPRFELQTRFEDGSTRRSTESELKAADMQTKLQQVAHHIANLTLAQQVEFAHQQRQYGNYLFDDKRYEEAIDVYLTCILVASKDKLMMGQIMNNLATCSMQLQWYRRTEQFCSIGLEQIEGGGGGGNASSDDDDDDDALRLYVAKLYYKRGKARRLSGFYGTAKTDLDRSLELLLLLLPEHENERRVVHKEMSLVAAAAVEGRRNKERAATAMKQVMGSPHRDPASNEPTWSNDATNTQQQSTMSRRRTKALYEDRTKKRAYSTLRSPKDLVDDGSEGDSTVDDPIELSYWQRYMLVVARVTERLLILLGDDDYRDKKKD